MYIITKSDTYVVSNSVYFTYSLQDALAMQASLQSEPCNTDEWIISKVLN